MNLLSSGRMNEYLASVDALAVNMFFWSVAEYTDKQSVTEQLKSENQCSCTVKKQATENKR